MAIAWTVAEAVGMLKPEPARGVREPPWAAIRSPRWPQNPARRRARAATITIPRWIQLVGLPVLALLAWALASTLGHALFLFLTASVIAFTLNPLVRDLQRLRLPRGLAVGIVYLLFVATVVVVLVLVATVVVDQGRTAADRIDAYVTEEDGRTGLTPAEVDVDRLQAWLDDHGLESIQVREQANEWIDSLSAGEPPATPGTSSRSPAVPRSRSSSSSSRSC